MVPTTQAVRADEHLHRLYADYAALPVGIVTQCAQNHAAMVHAAWLELPGRTWAERARAFYEDGEECLFDLLSQDPSREARLGAREADGSWAWWKGAGPRVLDYGGGLGLTSSLLRDAGKQVTYVDVDGAIARFASWFFTGAGQADVEVVTGGAVDVAVPRERTFDLVLAENVLEHVTDPVALVEALVRATGTQGLLCLRVDPRPATLAEPQRRELSVEQLLRRSAALRALEHVQCSDDGRHVFRRA